LLKLDHRKNPDYIEVPGWVSRYSDYATGWTVMNLGSIPGRSKRFIVFKSFIPVMGPTQPPIQWITESLSLEVKAGRVADHSLTFNSDVEKL
jgi:hypothetical protein